MEISTFGEIPELVAVYGSMAGLGTVNKTGDNVDSIAPGETGHFSGNAVDGGGTNKIQHDGTTMISGMQALFDGAQNQDSGLTIDFATGGYTFNPVTSGATVVMVAQKRATGNGQCFFTMDAGGGKTLEFSTTRSGSNHLLRVNSANVTHTAVAIDTDPHVYIFSHGAGADSAEFYIDGVDQGAITNQAPTRNYSICDVMGYGGSGSTNSLNGLVGLIAIYAKQLNATEITNVNALANHWMVNGAPPVVGPGPSATFGPVSTNDDPSVTGWQWEESPNGADWENVGTILSDVSGATTQTLTVNSAPIEADQTQVRCKAFSAKEPAPDGVISHTATLTVQP